MEINCVLTKSIHHIYGRKIPIHKLPSLEKTFVHKKQHLMQNNLNGSLAHDGLGKIRALNNGGIREHDWIPEGSFNLISMHDYNAVT